MYALQPFRRVVQEFAQLSKSYSINRARPRRIAPGIIKTKPKKYEQEDLFNDPKLEDELLKDYARRGTLDEPDIETFDRAYHEHNREVKSLHFKMRREKMVRNHFKEYIPQELNLLTYAEKEHIRYLHHSDPDNWSADSIAEAFPVSPDGAKKVIESIYRVRSYEEAIKHDKLVAKRIQLIKNGEIKLTYDLKRKMEIRDRIPFKLGAAQQSNHFGNNSPTVQEHKPPGEFESLVAPPGASAVKHYSEIYSYPSSPIIKEGQMNSDPEPQLYMQDRTEKSNVFEELNISPNQIMTISELESKIKVKKSKSRGKDTPTTSDSPTSQLDYLLSLDDKSLLNDKDSKASGDMWITESEFHPRTINNKFREDNEKDENNQKPASITNNSSADIPDNIVIPPELRKPGAVYKVGRSYYDDNGQFLYRIV